jgi:hypothetical protein
MVFDQEAYIEDSELSSISSPTITRNVLVSKRDGAGGCFEGGLCKRNGAEGAGAGDDGGGTCSNGGGRCQHVTVHRW